MTLLMILFLSGLFILAAVFSVLFTRSRTRHLIEKKLRVYGLQLISLVLTNAIFSIPKKKSNKIWNFANMDASSAFVTQNYLVTFSSGEKQAESLVAVDSYFFIFHKITFEKDLNNIF